MPIFEYACQQCGHQFETLVLKGGVPACPECKSESLTKLFSRPAVKSEGTKARALLSAKKRDASQGAERVAAQRAYEASHDD